MESKLLEHLPHVYFSSISHNVLLCQIHKGNIQYHQTIATIQCILFCEIKLIMWWFRFGAFNISLIPFLFTAPCRNTPKNLQVNLIHKFLGQQCCFKLISTDKCKLKNANVWIGQFKSYDSTSKRCTFSSKFTLGVLLHPAMTPTPIYFAQLDTNYASSKVIKALENRRPKLWCTTHQD